MKAVFTALLGCLSLLITATIKCQAQCAPGYSQIIVNIVPDNYPNETSWDIKDAANTVIASGTINNDTLCYPTGSLLHFTIHDTYGDGMCCSYGNGSYNVYLNGIVVATGGQFTFSQTTNFNYPPGSISSLLLNKYQQLLNHCNNTAQLSPAQLNAIADTIKFYHLYLADSLPVITSAFNVINCYESSPGPLL